MIGCFLEIQFGMPLLTCFLWQLPSFLADHPEVRLVVLDSVAFHFRHDWDDFAMRARMLNCMSQRLANIAIQHSTAGSSPFSLFLASACEPSVYSCTKSPPFFLCVFAGSRIDESGNHENQPGQVIVSSPCAGRELGARMHQQDDAHMGERREDSHAHQVTVSEEGLQAIPDNSTGRERAGKQTPTQCCTGRPRKPPSCSAAKKLMLTSLLEISRSKRTYVQETRLQITY